MYTRKDNKPFSIRDLNQILKDSVKEGNKVDLDAPISMSSDEEGNEMLSLYGVEISESGTITLWPAHI